MTWETIMFLRRCCCKVQQPSRRNPARSEKTSSYEFEWVACRYHPLSRRSSEASENTCQAFRRCEAVMLIQLDRSRTWQS